MKRIVAVLDADWSMAVYLFTIKHGCDRDNINNQKTIKPVTL